jgi:hypothetical protein
MPEAAVLDLPATEEPQGIVTDKDNLTPEQLQQESRDIYKTLSEIMSTSPEGNNTHRPTTKSWTQRFLGMFSTTKDVATPPRRLAKDMHYPRHDTDGEVIIEAQGGRTPKSADAYILYLNRIKGREDVFRYFISDGSVQIQNKNEQTGEYEPNANPILTHRLDEVREMLADFQRTK